MTAVVRVPISPSPNYLNRMVVLALSAQRAGGRLAEATVEAFVSPDRPRPPETWVAHLALFGVDWVDVPQDQFAIHSYGATGIERFRLPTTADSIVLADADLLFLAGLDEPIDRCAASDVVLGVTAYRSPFTTARYPARQELDRRSCWLDLFSRVGVELPELRGVHPAAYENDWDPDFAECPPYFNYGMLFVSPEAASFIGDSLYDEHRRIVEHFAGAHSGQLALSTALARLGLASEQLPIRYNFPNQEPYVDAYPSDFDDLRVLHYMSPKGFSKESDLDSASSLRAWVNGSHDDRVHRLLAEEFGRYLPALDECHGTRFMTDRRPIAWVANKQVNWPRVQELLLRSEKQNQWSNFGPVSLILEERIAEILDLHSSMKVVATSSGTAALDAISALEEYKLGRPPRWAVSSFGFHCTRLGPFRNAQIIDCDESALLDLDALSELDGDEYDGVLMTNVFGTVEDISGFVEFATARRKLFLADSAAAFDAAHRPGVVAPPVSEALSFHHTKPWGFGEGGAMIVAADDVGFARSVINFGLVSNRPVAAVATNAKMSEVAAAFIVSWLESIESLRSQTQEQFERIRTVAEDEGWRTLGSGAGSSAGLPPCVTLVAPKPVALDEYDGAPFVCRKYYEPLSATPLATSLFERMLNVPCHVEMSLVSDGELREVLSL